MQELLDWLEYVEDGRQQSKVRHKLKDMGYNCSLVNARFAKPIDTEIIKELSKEHRLLVTMEENVRSGGYGEKVRDFVEDHEIPVHLLTIALPDEYVEHGNVSVLRQTLGIDSDSVIRTMRMAWGPLDKSMNAMETAANEEQKEEKA